MSKPIDQHGNALLAVVPSDTRPIRRRGWDRCTRWVAITIALHLAAFAALPNYVCNCHFHLKALIIAIPPMFWGFYVFTRYRTWDERILAWVTVMLSAFWLFLAWESNVKFLFVEWYFKWHLLPCAPPIQITGLAG